jgi:hypothetical protein
MAEPPIFLNFEVTSLAIHFQYLAKLFDLESVKVVNASWYPEFDQKGGT